jgi:phage terminase small subunit
MAVNTQQTDCGAIITALTRKAREATDLPQKAQDFCVYYVLENIGSHAALAAGYSEGSQHSMAANWLRDRRAIALIRELRSLLPELRPIDPEAVRHRFGQLAMTDVADMLVPDERHPDADPPIYRFKRPEELTPGERALIQDVYVTDHVQKDEYGNVQTYQTFRYKLLSNKDSLDSLARTHGMFRDKIEHEHQHKIDALFQFIASTPETSETVAMLNKRYGREGHVIEGESTRISHNGPDSDPSP